MIRALALCLMLATPVASEVIVKAEFAEPTERYAHCILGDCSEWGALKITTGAQPRKTYVIRLPEDRVFEDLEPRLWDVTGDGAPEVVVVETQSSKGAQLAIYDETGKIAATDHIGRSNRWLAPVGVADLNGDGDIEIMYVDRPHLKKSLEIYTFRDGRLQWFTNLSGVTNHRIGEDFISGGIRDCGAGPQIVVATANWREVLTWRWMGYLTGMRARPNTGPDAFAQALSCK